jgi:alpha-D-ribose 1-methylphosphonate 5-triphosphate synthase subunit PhnH
MSAMMKDTLLPAWSDPVHASQATFRCILKALSEPGLRQTMPVAIEGPAPLDASTAALCLALADYETPVWCDAAAHTTEVVSYLRFHCGCPLLKDAATATFAVIANAADVRIDHFCRGSMEYPDRSTTLFIQVPTLVDGPERIISGPGIPKTRTLRVGGLPENFDALWHENSAAFPLGVDIVFCCGNDIVGLPRTARIHG